MIRKLIHLVGSVCALVVLAGLVAWSASAAPTGAPSTAILDPCLLVPADATLSLDAGVPWVGASMNGGYTGDNGYGNWQRPCRNFVVDVQVPSFSSAAGFLPSFSISAESTLNEDYCSIYAEWTRVYRKGPHDASFTKLGDVTRYGRSFKGDCILRTVAGSTWWPETLDPPSARTVTYRVVTGAGYDVNYPGYAYADRGVVAAHTPAG
jgi:hypothetical protein